MIHLDRGLIATRLTDDARGHTRHGFARRHLLQHHRTCGDARAVAHTDIAQNLGPGPDQNAIPDLGVAVLFFLAGAAKRDGMQHRDIVAHHRRFTDHDGMGMVDHDALADPCGRVDIDAEHL